jgi:hypothetical protein
MFSRDTLIIVTIPDFKSFNKRIRLLDSYNALFKTNIVYVVENMTNVLSAYLKECLDLDIKYFSEGVTVDYSTNTFIYNTKGQAISTAYNHIIDELEYNFYFCVDPGVLLYENVVSTIRKVPFRKVLGARFTSVENVANIRQDKELSFILDIVQKDIGDEISSDFCMFPNKEYKNRQYGVLLSRGSFLNSVGGFIPLMNRNFVHTAADMAAISGYELEFSHEFFTFKLMEME